jgi:hypothetical protein
MRKKPRPFSFDSSVSCLFSRITHPPDAVGAVVGDQQAAVLCHRDADRAAPYIAAFRDEAGQEVLVLADGFAAFRDGDGDDFIARAVRTVPRAMLGGAGKFKQENNALITKDYL